MFKYLTLQNIATFFLVLMCVQYIPLEGYKISFIKFGAMCLAPLIWLVYSPKMTKALMWGGLYLVTMFMSALFNIETFRASTLIYQCSFVFMYIMFYNLIYCEKAFTLDYFVKVLKGLILAYVGCLVLQQMFHLVGIDRFPLINTYSSYGRGWMAGNSLAIEPSHSARILAVLFISLLRMYEVKWGKENVNIKRIYADAKWVILGFLWSMLTMGSGTAFVALGVLSLYFIKRQYALSIVPLLVILYFAIPYTNFEPLQRAKVTIEAVMTMDSENVIKADGSAAVRVVPLMNTFTKLDLTKSETWFGKGVDSGGETIGAHSDESTIGGISSYGLLSYIIALIFLFSCVIYRFFSIETLLCFVLVGLTINNFAYIWGIYIILSTTKYFQESIKYKS